ADVVRMTFNDHDEDRLALELATDVLQDSFRARFERGFADVEHDARQNDDDAAPRIGVRSGELRQGLLEPEATRLGIALRQLALRSLQLRLRRGGLLRRFGLLLPGGLGL